MVVHGFLFMHLATITIGVKSRVVNSAQSGGGGGGSERKKMHQTLYLNTSFCSSQIVQDELPLLRDGI